MRLISMAKDDGEARVEFFGCPLKCDYCMHSKAEQVDQDLMEVLEFLADPAVNSIYLEGAEPGYQGEELLELLRRINRMPGKRVILKTTGHYPDFLRETIGMVREYMMEIKCPLDDLDCGRTLSGLDERRAEIYLRNQRETLEVLRGQRVCVWVRVIPGFLDEKKVARIGEQVAGVATSALLLQFLSNPENEAPFRGIEAPGPSESEMVDLGRILVKYVPQVSIRGNGFSSEFRMDTD